MKVALVETWSRTALFLTWQERQSRSCALFKAPSSIPFPAVTGVLWQARQVGAGTAPRAIAFPCSDARKCVLTSSWQLPHESAWSFSEKANAGSLTDLTSCSP